jgi:Sigma-54 interaction domain
MLAHTLSPVAPEWVILRSRRPNVLVTGSNDLISSVLNALTPHLHRPICDWTPDGSLPAADDSPTLLIRNVGALPMPQQCGLLAWLADRVPGSVQIVSTSSLELLRLVHDGAFLEALYYRLNVIRMDALTLTGQRDLFTSSAM